MPKLHSDPIGSDHLIEYLNGYSDFSFELKILSLARGLGLDCEHGGLYEDPVTKKAREFDIRACVRRGPFSVRLAIECKNIRQHFPLLVTTVPRHESESYNEVLLVGIGEANGPINVPGLDLDCKVLRIASDTGWYKQAEPVGKGLAQVGRLRDKPSELFATDSEVFEKWGQCLSSANDLVSQSYYRECDEQRLPRVAAVIPILVVPDDCLWQVHYGLDGIRQSDPRLVNHCSMFVGMSYQLGAPMWQPYWISHLEIMTAAGLSEFIRTCLRSEADITSSIIPNDGLHAAIEAAYPAHSSG